MAQASFKRAVFCDFDGTISASETFVDMMKRFAPELSAELMPAMYELRVTLREGVRRILESIPSSCYPYILASMRGVALRPGFAEFADFLRQQQVPLIVVSGGLREMVETALGDLKQRVHAIHAIEARTDQPKLAVQSEFEAGDEMVAKVNVMKRYPADEQIAIGDSVTDLNMGQHATLLFARDRLQRYMDERNIAYQPWDDFHAIRRVLSQRWGLA